MATAPTLYWYQLDSGTLSATYFGQLNTTVAALCSENAVTAPTAPWQNSIGGALVSKWQTQVDTAVRSLCTTLAVTPPIDMIAGFNVGQYQSEYMESLDGVVRLLCAGTAYHADAVHFDGLTYLVSASGAADMGVTASPLGIFSIWVKQANQGDLGSVWGAFTDMGSDRYLNIHPTNDDISGGFAMGFGDGGASSFPYVNYFADAPFFSVGSWDHILISWNTNFPIGSKRIAVYKNRVQQPNDIAQDLIDAFSVGLNNEEFWVGTIGGVPPSAPAHALTGDTADEYLDIGHTIVQADGTITSADLDKFITSGLKPVNLGINGSTPTGAAPSFFLTGTSVSFPANAAGNGAFVINGVGLTNASTSPSD